MPATRLVYYCPICRKFAGHAEGFITQPASTMSDGSRASFHPGCYSEAKDLSRFVGEPLPPANKISHKFDGANFYEVPVKVTEAVQLEPKL